MSSQVKRKKVNLLEFQKALNEQFFEVKQQQNNISAEDSNEMLGVTVPFKSFNFFIPLKDLKTIAMENNFESVDFTKPWISGFNHERGDVYTILSFNKIANLLINNVEDKNFEEKKMSSRVIYLQDYLDVKSAFLVDDLKLEYTVEFTKFFNFSKNEDKVFWELSEEIDFDLFLNPKFVKPEEMDLLKKMKEVNSNTNSLSLKEEQKNILYFIKDVYLDGMGQKPIFVLDVQAITKYLISLNPY